MITTLRRAVAAAAALGIAAGGLALSAPAASAKPARSPFTSNAPQLSMVIPDQPKPVADALAGAARWANDLHPEDPFVVTDVIGPTTVIGYYEGTEQVARHPDYRDCLRKVENGVIRVPCPRLIPF